MLSLESRRSREKCENVSCVCVCRCRESGNKQNCIDRCATKITHNEHEKKNIFANKTSHFIKYGEIYIFIDAINSQAEGTSAFVNVF